MEKDITRYQKHLTLQDRYEIEEGLNTNHTLTDIAEMLGKDKSTISKEIRKHRIGDTLRISEGNDCIHKYRCPIKYICPDCTRNLECHACRKTDCRMFCDRYQSNACKKTIRVLYVCNGCNSVYDCRKPHFYYRAVAAHTAYKEQLKGSREGISMTNSQIHELDCLLTPLLKQGQSIAHIYVAHEDEIPCSMRTLYSYIDQGIFTARNIDLPKKVKCKPRKKRKKDTEVDYVYREERTYQDFQEWMAEHIDSDVVEMDTVHGPRASGKVMLTMLFRSSSLMLIFLIDDCTQKCVIKVFDQLTEILGLELFKTCFPLILTDNGSEFKNPLALERTASGDLRTKIFYCDPLVSWQKGRLEKNHEYIRKVIPKGRSIDRFSQKEMTLLANHINSAPRASLNGRTPFEMARLLNSLELLSVLELKALEPDQIILKPILLK